MNKENMDKENVTVQNRLAGLRRTMAEEKIDFYLIPTADFHSSEYVNGYFKVREYFCGFTGSNGTLLVWQKGAGLWTDGRYFIQAEKELAGTGVTLYRMQEEGVPAIEEFLENHMTEGQTLGFDGRVVPAALGKKYAKLLSEKKIRFVCGKDPAEAIWQDRPAFPAGEIYVIPEEIAGMSVEEKLSQVRKALCEKAADALFLTKLDDIMWLYNIRGCDVECNPVAMSYGYITDREAVLFIQQEAITPEAGEYLQKHGIRTEEYDRVFHWLDKLPAGRRIWLDERYAGYAVYELLHKRHTVLNEKNPTEKLKAVKNGTELENMRKIFLKDSVAVTKFIYWLKTNIGRTEITETGAAEYLDNLRRSIPEFLDLSFPTIDRKSVV